MNTITVNTNKSSPKFMGLKYNNSLRMAKEYAISTGQKDIFKNARQIVDSLAGDSLTITVRKNKYPEECLHVSILNKDFSNRFIGGIDYLHPGNDSVGETTFNILNSLADKTSNIYKTVFNK